MSVTWPRHAAFYHEQSEGSVGKGAMPMMNNIVYHGVRHVTRCEDKEDIPEVERYTRTAEHWTECRMCVVGPKILSTHWPSGLATLLGTQPWRHHDPDEQAKCMKEAATRTHWQIATASCTGLQFQRQKFTPDPMIWDSSRQL